jgi:hypothetical protein
MEELNHLDVCCTICMWCAAFFRTVAIRIWFANTITCEEGSKIDILVAHAAKDTAVCDSINAAMKDISMHKREDLLQKERQLQQLDVLCVLMETPFVT